MEKDIGKINKNDQTDIVVRIDDFGGKTGLTIREFVTSDRYTGFTKAGVGISAENFPKFKEMINSISEADLQSPESEEGVAETTNPPKEQKKLDESEEVQVEKPGKSSEDELPDY